MRLRFLYLVWHAVSNTMQAIGLNGATETIMKPVGGTGMGVPTIYLSPIPNLMYTNLIINNMKNFVIQYGK
jgi:hypothetical protein